MATITYIKETKQTAGAMKGLINYCTQSKKTEDENSKRKLVTGVNCDGDNAFAEFLTTKNTYQKMEGVNFYQYVQSFSPGEKISPMQAHQIALEFAARAWPGHEVLVATHIDAPHLHSHFVINSVSYETGYKLRQNPSTLKTLRKLSDEICINHGLDVLKPYEKGGAKLSAREYRSAAKNESWKFKLIRAISDAMNHSGNRDEFLRQMAARGYGVTWTEGRKNITFICPSGMKCRDSRLHDEKFLKEILEYELNTREQITAQLRRRIPDEAELRELIRTGTHPLSSSGLRNSRGPENAGEETLGGRSKLSADSIQADPCAGYERGAGGLLKPGIEYLHEKHEPSRGISDGGEFGNPGKNTESNGTGWEKSREFYFHGLLSLTGTENLYQEGLNCGSGFGDSFVGLAFDGLAEAANIIENTSEDPEEKHRRMEAQENGSDFGAVLGLAAGVILTATGEDSRDLAGDNRLTQNM